MMSISFGRRLAAALATASLVLMGPAGAARAEARPVLEQDWRVRVMPLGDSITWGVGSSSEDSYRSALYWRLAAAGVNADFVGSQRSGDSPDPDNEGHKGWTIAQLADHVDEWLWTYEPDVILLHIGTNDMVRGVQDAPRQLDALLDKIAEDLPTAQVFVAKIVGLGDYSDTPAQRFRTVEYNAAIPAIVASKGPNFHLVDQSNVHGIDMFNREHPNDYGYRKMAWNWYSALSTVLDNGGGAWPSAGNPYRAGYGYRCLQRSTLGRAAQGCHTWYQRRPGVWQLPFAQKVRYRVKVGGKVVTRVRIVTRWLTAA